MVVTHHREKLINAITYFAEHTKYCGKTKLLKLLYLLDFCHFKQTGKSVTGLEYFAWEKGPVPVTLYEELSGKMNPDLKEAINIVQIDDFQKIAPKKKFADKYFTKREREVMAHIALIYRDAKAQDMIEVTHFKNEPWHKTLKEKGPFKKIDYMLSIDDMKNSLPYDEAQDRMEEISEMHEIFGKG